MDINVIRLDHVQVCIPIGAENQARKFYGDILRLKEIEKPEVLKPNGGLWYQIGDIQLHIGVEKIEGKSKRHPAFEVKNLAAIKTYLTTKGVRIKEDKQIPNIVRFSFYDPFDNRIEFLEKLKS